jgi:hypothetical protein
MVLPLDLSQPALASPLDPNDPRDGAAFAANGYTNVENYLNRWLATRP